MIGGNDILFRTAGGAEALDLGLRAARRLWPRAVFEDAETGQVFEQYASLDLSGRMEILVYRDSLVAKSWRELGADESLTGTLIHLLLSEEALTVVVDATPSAEIQAYLTSIRQGLRQGIFSPVAAA